VSGIGNNPHNEIVGGRSIQRECIVRATGLPIDNIAENRHGGRGWPQGRVLAGSTRQPQTGETLPIAVRACEINRALIGSPRCSVVQRAEGNRVARVARTVVPDINRRGNARIERDAVIDANGPVVAAAVLKNL